MVIKQSLGVELAFPDRSASSMSKCSAAWTLTSETVPFGTKSVTLSTLIDVVENLHRFYHINGPLTSRDDYNFANTCKQLCLKALRPVKPYPGVPGIHLHAENTVVWQRLVSAAPGRHLCTKFRGCSRSVADPRALTCVKTWLGVVATVKKWQP